ncbi:uncharacterized protein LOC132924795 [Rhopalosiphum padi]|uniref:uncharacterized protein LOC132924795 n=1 Tax=Rhopalosiphum padi TaxID=40932 RepID=UPI00298E1D85|nr:uncharacterized protein LOC132924795 [Rhopalosiphum padi]
MSREFTEEFIKLYESEPCLWNVKSKEYHDRNKKDTAYRKLVNKQQEIESNATKDSVIKKINNLRSAYRKENKKIKQSIKSGTSADTVYKPKLWYFSLLSFLGDQNTPRTSHSSLENDFDNDNSIFGNDSDNEEQTPQALATSSAVSEENIFHDEAQSSDQERTPLNIRRKKQRVEVEKQEGLANEVLLTVKDHFRKPAIKEDRFDMSGRTIAMKLRDLPKDQMLFADRIINETLFLAEMGSLQLKTVNDILTLVSK